MKLSLILDCSKLKESADNNFKLGENDRKLSKWVENTVGKGEIARYEPHFDTLKIYSCGKHCEKRRNCLYQAISSFPTVFSTLCDTYYYTKFTLNCRLQFVSFWTTLKFYCLVMGLSLLLILLRLNEKLCVLEWLCKEY